MPQNNNQPLVSVIIPTYNRSDFVKEAIGSVLTQTYPNYELIVIDDGSTDGTESVVKSKYKHKLFYIWQQNQGESIARNYGISISKGKYLSFLDSDDKWHPSKLMEQVAYLEKRRKKESNIALVCSSARLINHSGDLISKKLVGRKLNLENFEMADFLSGPRVFAPPSNALYVSEFVKEVGGFDEDLTYGEDWHLLVKLREKYKFVYLDKPLLYYRIHENNQQNFPKLLGIEKLLSDQLKVIDSFPKSQVHEYKIRQAKAHIYESAAYTYFHYQDRQNGLFNLQIALKFSPDIINQKRNVIQKIAKTGLQSAVEKGIKKPKEMLNYYENDYYVNLKSMWPNALLSQPDVKKKSIACFSLNMVYDETIDKTRSEKIELCLKAFSDPRYLRSFTTWKILVGSIFSRSL